MNREEWLCEPSPECPLWDIGECPTLDRHHIWWPRRHYDKGVAKQFRNLAENIVLSCVVKHREYHASELPPDPPSREDMLAAIQNNLLEDGGW